MANFTPPAGVAYITASTTYEKTVTFRNSIATSPPAIATPAVPATTVKVTNTTGVNVVIYLTSGTGAVTEIDVNGVATGLQLTTAATSNATVYLSAGSTIALTYAATAPTWVWVAV